MDRAKHSTIEESWSLCHARACAEWTLPGLKRGQGRSTSLQGYVFSCARFCRLLARCWRVDRGRLVFLWCPACALLIEWQWHHTFGRCWRVPVLRPRTSQRHLGAVSHVRTSTQEWQPWMMPQKASIDLLAKCRRVDTSLRMCRPSQIAGRQRSKNDRVLRGAPCRTAQRQLRTAFRHNVRVARTRICAHHHIARFLLRAVLSL